MGRNWSCCPTEGCKQEEKQKHWAFWNWEHRVFWKERKLMEVMNCWTNGLTFYRKHQNFWQLIRQVSIFLLRNNHRFIQFANHKLERPNCREVFQKIWSSSLTKSISSAPFWRTNKNRKILRCPDIQYSPFFDRSLKIVEVVVRKSGQDRNCSHNLSVCLMVS